MQSTKDHSARRSATLLIVEHGVDWGAWAERCQRAHQALTLVAQLPHERATRLAHRAQERALLMHAHDERLNEVLLVGNGGSDEVVVERWRTVRALLPMLRRSSGARLVLAASGGDLRGQRAMETFAQVLADELRGDVLVRFEPPPARQEQRRARRLALAPHPRRASRELTAE